MFDRLTDRAKKATFLARQEALRLNHREIDTEHMLLGLIHDDSCGASRTLRKIGVDLDAIRNAIEKAVELGKPPKHPITTLPFTSGAKKVLERSMEEASALGHNYVATEHVLLGLLREEKGIAGRTLHSCGVLLDEARAAVADLAPSPPLSKRETWHRDYFRLARRESVRRDDSYVDTEHLLLALLDDSAGRHATLLQRRQLEPDRVREEVARVLQSRARRKPLLEVSSRIFDVLKLANIEAGPFAPDGPGTEHLLLALLNEPEGVAGEALRNLGLTAEAVRREIADFPGSNEPPAP